ncbi:tail fiber assembly protein [Burkholderia vietnamiensis]|uniref:tail fiber assembly protein n=1 Tax=Burkholderia vietnamiensis TaxID=60552 RepID=UPI0026569618|nr:tail fiber assembly protein [Burkholderia vietnamiensis]MDN7411441.1 tail fiber assembly protein [Burkholderia vietnamiensis]HDR9022682.1 phage tail assembly chaperone [Burkholderia vietnamiensis]HDR9199269.1 phage tail assembly chaperone [Burkholderia vietnamiensis]
MFFDVRNWYWIVGDDASRVWSSQRAKFVDVNDAEYVEWLQAGGAPTRIDTIDSLGETLFTQYPAGTPQTAAVVRAKRNSALAVCDWIAIRQADAGTLSETQWAAWKSYRQALRDIPTQNGFPSDVAWPTTPN